MKYMEPGVYFGLPFEEYLADNSLSSSGIRDILVSPQTYWMKRNDPSLAGKDSPAMALGRAAHKRILEGEEAYLQQYAVRPDIDDHPEAVDGVDDLRAMCGDLGLKKNGTKLEMCARILEVSPDALLWPLIIDRWEKENQGKAIIKHDDHKRIEGMTKFIAIHPSARGAIRNGAAEVSVFWVDADTGVRLKARIDYLRANEIIDLKTFSNPVSAPIDIAAIRAIAGGRYHIQAAMYMEAAREARVGLLMGRYFGDVPKTLVKKLEDGKKPHRFYFIMIESTTFDVVMKEFVREVDEAETMFFGTGQRLFREGVQTFAACNDMYSYGQPWVTSLPPTPINDSQVPMYAMGE